MDAFPAEAYWITGPGEGAILPCCLPPCGSGDVIVKTLYSAISRGTESLVFRGQVPPSQYQAMRAPFQDGDFPAPVKYGYCAVGRIVDGPADRIGQLVFALYPHQTAFAIPAAAAVPLPPGLPAARAVLAANMETAVNALWDASLRVGDRVAVVGAGVVGCLVGYLAARMPGTSVTLVDVDAGRSGTAARLGAGFATPAEAPGDCDVVFHASASEAGLATALSLAGFEATVVELSWYGRDRPAIPLGEAFHSRRLIPASSQVGAVSPCRRGRRSHRDRLDLALSLLCDPALDCLITGESAFADLPQVMRTLSATPGGTLCHRIAYPDP